MKKKGNIVTRLFRALKREFTVSVDGANGDNWAATAINRLLADWVTKGTGVEGDITANTSLLRARARDLAANNAYASAYLNLAAVNVIGPKGFKLSALVRDETGALVKDKNDAIEESWKQWSQSRVSRDDRLDLVSFQQMLMRVVARDGEAFVRIWTEPNSSHGILLESIDASLIDESYNESGVNGVPYIVRGVEMDKYGKPVAYWILNLLPTGAGGTPSRTRIPASEIIHLYRMNSSMQVRGVSWLTPAMLTLQHIRGYVEAELVAARAGSAKMGFFVNKDGTSGLDPTVGGDKDMITEASPGSMEILPPGYSFESWNPDHPNAAFPAFIKSALREVATGWYVSYNALANDLEGVNYSSMRSGLLIERDVWRTLQQWWIASFLSVVYKQWMRTALFSGGLPLKPLDIQQYMSCRWTPRGWQWVDPQKDADAGITQINNGLASHSMLLEEQGHDYEEVLEQLKEEQALAKELGVEIKEEKPTAASPGQPKAAYAGTEEEA